MNALTSFQTRPTMDWRRVLKLRNIALAGPALVVVVAGYNFNMPLPYAGIIGVLVVLNVLTWVRLRLTRPVTEGEVFTLLLFDGALLSALLYFVGGAANPFVLLLLLPLIIGAATLQEEYAWGMVAAIVTCYTLLMFFYIPLPNTSLTYSRGFNLETWGLWFGFVMSAELIAYLVMKVSNTLRDRERMIAEIRENALRDERLVALGALAVGTAHELGTPLGTMAILLKDLERDYAGAPNLSEKLTILRNQVERCKTSLSNMLSSTGQSRAEAGYGIALDSYLENVVVQWRAMRPAASVRYRWEGARPAPKIVAEQALGQALINILNNAADASEDDVEIAGHWDERELRLEVYDRGAGLAPAVGAHAGDLFFTTKATGHGLGLSLARAIFGRFGGALQLSNRAGGGACTRITLPLSKLSATASP